MQTIPQMLSTVQNEVTSTIYAMNSANCNQSEVSLTCFNEIKSIIASFKTKKVPGLDEIGNIVLKNLSDLAINNLLATFNFCVSHSHFSKQLKVAKVIPIPMKVCISLSPYKFAKLYSQNL